jgi:stress-induced morphogen
MLQTGQRALKELFTAQYVNNPQEWFEVNISKSGLLNLTIVSDYFVGLSIPERKKQVLSFLEQSQNL